MRDEIYENITRKLGVRPEEYVPHYEHTECDNMESPLELLTLEELLYFRDYTAQSA